MRAIGEPGEEIARSGKRWSSARKSDSPNIQNAEILARAAYSGTAMGGYDGGAWSKPSRRFLT